MDAPRRTALHRHHAWRQRGEKTWMRLGAPELAGNNDLVIGGVDRVDLKDPLRQIQATGTRVTC